MVSSILILDDEYGSVRFGDLLECDGRRFFDIFVRIVALASRKAGTAATAAEPMPLSIWRSSSASFGFSSLRS